MPTSKIFSWINFREWPGLKNFAWIYFREDRDFEKYFSLKKRKTTLLSLKSFYKSSKNYKYVNNESVKIFTRWDSLTKSEQSLFNDVFFSLFKICEKAEEEGQNWKNSKACTF